MDPPSLSILIARAHATVAAWSVSVSTAPMPRLLVEDVSHDPKAPMEAHGAPAIDGLGFRHLGYAAITEPGVELEATDLFVITVYVAKYGDAIAFVEPFEEDIRVRIVTVLDSGRIIETRAIRAANDEDFEPDDPFLAWLGSLPLPVIDRFLTEAASQRVSHRFPSLPRSGLVRQTLEVQDGESLWLAHRGLVRQEQGDDHVIDHGSMAVVRAAMRRAYYAALPTNPRAVNKVNAITQNARNAFLALPAVVGMLAGLPWWMAGLVAVFTAAGALGVRQILGDRSLRRWLLLVPPAIVAVGYITMGWAALTVSLVYGLAIVLAAELGGPTVVRSLLSMDAYPTIPTRPVIPMPDLLTAYDADELPQ